MCIPTSNVYGTNVGIRGSDSAPAAGGRGAAAVWVLLDGEEGRAERGLGCRRAPGHQEPQEGFHGPESIRLVF